MNHMSPVGYNIINNIHTYIRAQWNQNKNNHDGDYLYILFTQPE